MFAIVAATAGAAADAPALHIRTLDGMEWPAASVAYRAGTLVVRPAGAACTLALAQIDWEATARQNGAVIDLLRLPESDVDAPLCRRGPDLVADADPDDTSSLPASSATAPTSPESSPAAKWRPPRDTERYRAVAVRTSTRPLLDGALDDPAWQQAIPFGEFFQQERHEGEPATERTVVRILYDAENLYFAIRCYDAEPDRVVARNMIREGQLQSDDGVTILLDPLHDHRTAYLFGTNPNGMRVDSYLLGNSQNDANRDWDGVWNAAARRDAEGWTAEIQIPFTTLRFRPAEIQTWGLAIRRRIARKNEPSFWPFIPNDSTFYRPSQAGHLDGLRGARPGASVRLKPYAALGASADYTTGIADRVRDAGIDVRYWPTATLTTELTVNTDFAQTEVDDVQINLTRFPLYYPEKRQFFLEGGRIFDVGSREAQIFYTRRIGLSTDRRPIPVVAGARLTGKVGPYYIGALGIRTAAQGASPVSDAYVVRAARDVSSRSQVGGIYTERRGSAGDYQRVVGADAAFYRGNALSVNAYAAKLFDPDVRAGTWAGRSAVGWNVDRWGLTASFATYGDNFAPELGFVPRPGMRCYITNGRYSPRPGLGWIRRLYLEPTVSVHTTQHGVLWSRAGGASARMELESGDNVTIRHDDSVERLFAPFPVRAGQSVPSGRYTFATHGVSVSTFDGRTVRGEVAWSTGRFYNGQRSDVEASATLRLNRHISVAPGLTRSLVSLPPGGFAASIASTRVTYTFTPNLSLSSLMQWDSDSRAVVTNLRFNYIPKPGADVYVVYTEADQLTARVAARNRSIIAKINYILDF